MRTMNVGDEIVIPFEPEKMSLSSIRSTASSLGIDMGRKYAVKREDGIIRISRKSKKKSSPSFTTGDGFQRKGVQP